MLRIFLAAAYLLTIPGTVAWAQVARAAASPETAAIAPLALASAAVRSPVPVGMSILSGPSLTAALSAPAASASSPSAAAAAPAAVPIAAKGAVAAEDLGEALVVVPSDSEKVSARAERMGGLRREREDLARCASPLDAVQASGRVLRFAKLNVELLGLQLRPAVSWAIADSGRSSPAETDVRLRASAPAAGSAPIPEPGALAPSSPRRLAGYLFGTLGAQLASNALQVTMPLLFLKLTGSAAHAAFAVAIGSAFDAGGTLVGGRLTDRVRAKNVLLATTVLRGAAVLALPLAAPAGGLSLPLVAGAYLVECFLRGVADTARSTLPVELAGFDEGFLKKILAKNQAYFEAGGIAGPFLAGVLIAGLGGVASPAALWLAPAVFCAVTLCYLAIPLSARAVPAVLEESNQAQTPKLREDWMRWALAATALSSVYPLKGLLPAVFAIQILHDAASAAWLTGLFGVGGFLGALAYGRLHEQVGFGRWLTLGAVGTLAFAAAFLPGAFVPAALGVLAFSLVNVAARLALSAAIQSRVVPGRAGAAMGPARFTANMSGLAVRFLFGLAFTAALAPATSFWIVGAGLTAAGTAMLVVAQRLSAPIKMSPHPTAFVGAEPDANPFDKDPAADAENIRRNYLNEKRGAHFYFRNMLLPMQERFAQLMDMAAMPRVLLHGSPHIDNYAKSHQGAAMVDFDRSRVGPYAWDLVRLMVSLALRQKKPAEGLLDADVLKRLKKGYLRGFRRPDRPFSEARMLKDLEPGSSEETTDAYLKNGKWAKEMRGNPLPVDDADVVKLVRGYDASLGGGLLDDYVIEEAGRGQGSMGFRGLFLVVLAPKDKKSGLDRILLNIKQVRADADTAWYKNIYETELERMHTAAELYAPGWSLRPGGAILDGVEYDVRQIDPQNAKVKKLLNREQQADIAYAVGTQLGRAHRLSLQDGATAAALEKHLADNFGEIVAAGLTIRDEIELAHARYLKNMRRSGLMPGEGDDE